MLYYQLYHYLFHKYENNENSYEQYSLSNHPKHNIISMTSVATEFKKEYNINKVYFQPKSLLPKSVSIHHHMNGYHKFCPSKAHETLSGTQKHPLKKDLEV